MHLLSLLFYQVIGGFISYLFIPTIPAALSGALLVTWLFWIYQHRQLHQLLRWFSKNTNRPPKLRGKWSELSYYWQRRQKKVNKRIRRLQDVTRVFRDALEASSNGVIITDHDQIEWFNSAASRHFALDKTRDGGQSITNLLRNPDFTAYYAAQKFQESLLMQGRGQQLMRPEPVRLEVTIEPYGKSKKLILSRDISQHAQLELMRRDFVANVSHEIRTPLTVILGFIESLQHISMSTQEQKDALSVMQSHAERIKDLVSDLLNLSELEHSPLPSLEPVSVSRLMANCLTSAITLSQNLSAAKLAPQHVFEAGYYDDAQNWHTDIANVEFGAILGQEKELYSAFLNLLSNAVRYTPEGTVIHLSWQIIENGSGCFTVTDNGPGIATAHLSLLTERFYRPEAGRARNSGGTGLGLAIVKSIAQRHGAKLDIHSIQGEGSSFSLIFPAERVVSQLSQPQLATPSAS